MDAYIEAVALFADRAMKAGWTPETFAAFSEDHRLLHNMQFLHQWGAPIADIRIQLPYTPVPDLKKVMDISISDCPHLSTRTINALKHAHIRDLADLVRYSTDHIKSIRGVGKLGCERIKLLLNEMGLNVDMKFERDLGLSDSVRITGVGEPFTLKE